MIEAARTLMKSEPELAALVEAVEGVEVTMAEKGFGTRVEVRALEDSGLSEADLVAQMRQEPGHPMGTHGGERRIEPTRGETAYFLERALGEHRIETPIDALAKLVARGFKEEADAVLRRKKRRRTLPLLPFKK